jgi:hypothetical protein
VYYASPKDKRVVAEPLEAVMAKTSDYRGIQVYALHPERMAFVEQPTPEPEESEPEESQEPATP